MDDNLSALVQALPTELCNEIFELTFTSTPPKARFIHKTYKPPNCLQISQVTRQQFAQHYYGENSVFYVSKSLAVKFMTSLPECHRELIGEIRIIDLLFDREGIPGTPQSRVKMVHCMEVGSDRFYLVWLLDTLEYVHCHVTVRVSYPDGVTEWTGLHENEFERL